MRLQTDIPDLSSRPWQEALSGSLSIYRLSLSPQAANGGAAEPTAGAAVTALRSIQYAVSTAAHAALEDRLFFAICLQARSRTPVKAAIAGTFADIAVTDGAAYGTDDGTGRSALGDAFFNAYLVGVGFAFSPVLFENRLVDALQIDNGLRMRRAAGDK